MKRVVLALCAALAFGSAAHAQVDRAQLSGTLRDSSGAVIAAGTVTATHLATNVASRAQTAGNGSYIIVNLAPGQYLVEAEATGSARFGLPHGRVHARLGDPGEPRQVSLIALHEHGIPYEFSGDVLEAAEAAEPVPVPHGEDLTGLPLLTIDPEDARDHDDAVAAFADDDPANRGGWVVWVAIADVAWYVRPGSALDREADD